MEMDRRRLNGGDETTLASERNHLTVEELPNRRGNGFVVSVPPLPRQAHPTYDHDDEGHRKVRKQF